LFAGRTLLRSLLIGAAATVLLMPATAAHADPSPAEIQAQIDKGNNQLEFVVEQYNKINGDLDATQAALTALNAKMQPLQAGMDAAMAKVNQIAVNAYQSASSLRTMSVLLSARTSDSFVDQYTTLQQLSRDEQLKIDNFRNVKRGYDAERKRLDQLLAAQNAQKAELATKKTKIEGDIARLDAMQQKLDAMQKNKLDASGGTTTTTPKSTTKPSKTTTAPPKTTSKYRPPAASTAGQKAVAYAHAQLGKRYVYGTAGPNTFDCSGLTMAAWKSAGVSLPHNAAQQWSRVRHIARSQLTPGDLVFYNGLGHVAIYIGNNQVIHAPNSRTVVKIAPIDTDPLYGFGRP